MDNFSSLRRQGSRRAAFQSCGALLWFRFDPAPAAPAAGHRHDRPGACRSGIARQGKSIAIAGAGQVFAIGAVAGIPRCDDGFRRRQRKPFARRSLRRCGGRLRYPAPWRRGSHGRIRRRGPARHECAASEPRSPPPHATCGGRRHCVVVDSEHPELCGNPQMRSLVEFRLRRHRCRRPFRRTRVRHATACAVQSAGPSRCLALAERAVAAVRVRSAHRRRAQAVIAPWGVRVSAPRPVSALRRSCRQRRRRQPWTARMTLRDRRRSAAARCRMVRLKRRDSARCGSFSCWEAACESQSVRRQVRMFSNTGMF